MDLIKKEKTYYLSGVVDENTDFNKILGNLEQGAVVNGKDVKKINSIGVKHWINYFNEQKNIHSEFYFEELSPVLVEQLNFLCNFCVKNKVMSLMVPFACSSCKKETILAIDIPSLKNNPNPSPVFCQHCRGQALFDDLPDEYFACLENLD